MTFNRISFAALMAALTLTLTSCPDHDGPDWDEEDGTFVPMDFGVKKGGVNPSASGEKHWVVSGLPGEYVFSNEQNMRITHYVTGKSIYSLSHDADATQYGMAAKGYRILVDLTTNPVTNIIELDSNKTGKPRIIEFYFNKKQSEYSYVKLEQESL